MEDPNPHEELARSEKVRKLVDIVLEYNQHAVQNGKTPFTSEDAILLTREEWAKLAASKGIRPPSMRSILGVAQELKRMERLKE